MGPLYHLAERHDRLKALQEARRVISKNGIRFAVIIPRWASALVGMMNGWTYDSDYAAMVRQELVTTLVSQEPTYAAVTHSGKDQAIERRPRASSFSPGASLPGIARLWVVRGEWRRGRRMSNGSCRKPEPSAMGLSTRVSRCSTAASKRAAEQTQR